MSEIYAAARAARKPPVPQGFPGIRVDIGCSCVLGTVWHIRLAKNAYQRTILPNRPGENHESDEPLRRVFR